MAESEKYLSREPWSYDGRTVLDAGGAPLATAADPADARRIVAAVNAVQGMPTDALESWTTEVIHDPAEELERDSLPASEPYPNDRRTGRDRRVGDRRRSALDAPSPWEVRAPEGMSRG